MGGLLGVSVLGCGVRWFGCCCIGGCVSLRVWWCCCGVARGLCVCGFVVANVFLVCVGFAWLVGVFLM